MKFYFLPIERHADLGFGTTADSFRKSGCDLLNMKPENKTNMDRLPSCFLLRHSIELYLKSMIIVVHKGLNIPFKNGSDFVSPEIYISGKSKKLFSIHSIGILFEYFNNLVKGNAQILKKAAKTDWTDIPAELEKAIKRIEAFDSKSSYFRYPISTGKRVDAEKSAFKSIRFEELAKKMKAPKSKGIQSFLLKDDNDNIVESYIYDDTAEIEILDDLKSVSETLSGAHFGLRIELVEGY